VSLVNEKQQRTLVALTVTPTSLGEVLVSKALLGAGISLVMGLTILALNRMLGSQPLLLAFVLGLSAIAAAIFGILLGTLVKDMNGLFTIVKASAILLYAPAIINMIPQLPQELAQIFPTYYIMAPIVEIIQRDGGLIEIGGYLIVLVGLIGLLAGVLVYIATYKERRAAFVS
jgi:ABC-2 type transport system permease protein